MHLPQEMIDQVLDSHDRYRLERLLAGRVYLATDLFTGEVVALKLLRRSSGHQENRAFVYEMALHYAIGNHWVVAVKDFGITKTGCFFYTMEYVEGTTLTQLLNTLTPDRALSIFRHICQALVPAHQGVILSHWHLGTLPVAVPHQKLHPDHVLITEADRVTVLNFGFISEVDSNSDTPESSQNTLVTTLGGEFHYIAPEQLEKAEGDTRSDIYVLGMLLYEMLSGTNPYGVQVQNGLPWVMAHATTAPVPLRQRSGCQNLPPKLEQIVHQCLEKEPSKRYPNVVALLTDLEQIPSLEVVLITDENPTQPHIFDGGSRIIAEPDGTQTVTLSAVPQDKTTLSVPLEEASTLLDQRPLTEYQTELGDAFTIGEPYGNYSTFLEGTPPSKPPLILISITLAIVVSLGIFAGVVLWQRQKLEPKPPPARPPIDRSI